MSLCKAASPSPTASSRDAFWPPHCSPFSSASCFVRQKRNCQTASTSVFEQTAVTSTFGVSSHARKPSRNSSLIELLFADDCALLAHTEEALQQIVDHFPDAAKNVGLTISLKKTEVVYQPPLREAYSPPHISIDGTNLNAVEHFTYPGSVISNDVTVSKNLDNRLF